jgi:hypothetical protein
MITGSVQDDTYNFQQNNFGQSCMPDPCLNGCQLRWIDGTWLAIAHFTNNVGARNQAITNSNPYMFWPQRDNSTTDNAETDNTGSEVAIFTSFASNTEIVSITEINALPLYPVILVNANQLICQMDGLYVVPGNGLSAGDTLTVGSDTYDVFHNTWRTEFPDFFAMKRA